MLFEITSAALDPQRLIEEVRRDESGAVALFSGVVRNNNLGRRVLYLEYDAYPEMAEKLMRQIAEEIMRRWPAVSDIAIQHRTGRLEIGETSLLVALSSPHRKEAFEACHALVDRFKEVVPIWKKEVWEDGEEWIEGEPLFFENAGDEADPQPETSSSGAAKPPGRIGSDLWDDSGDPQHWRLAPIEDLNLSMRSYNCLRRGGLIMVWQVMRKSEEELLALRNFSRKCYVELRERLDEIGIVPLDADWDTARRVN